MRPVLVSVVIATWRRPDLLARCLAALRVQTLDGHDYEVIVADDDAGHPGATRIEALVAEQNASTGGAPRVRYVPVRATQGPAGARNAGWRASDARVIAFTDDDTIPDPSWLANGLAALTHAAQPYDAVGGAIHMPLPAAPTDYERDAAGLSHAEFATANCFVLRAALDSLGGFDERFTSAWREDSDLHFGLLEAGYRVGHADDAVVVHPVRPAPPGISLSQQRKVVFDVLLFKKHRALYRERIRRRPPWLYYVNVGAVLVALVAAIAGAWTACGLALAIWLASTLRFALRRLDGTSRRAAHVAEMLWTSIAIPPLALWWRLVGVLRYRVVFF